MSVKWYGKKIENDINAAIRAGLTMAAMVVQTNAKLRCPVDASRLRNSITHRLTKTSALIGTNVEYAPWVEFGTGIYAEGGGGRKDPWVYFDEKEKKFFRTRGRKPKPFLRPALDENKQEIINIYYREFHKRL